MKLVLRLFVTSVVLVFTLFSINVYAQGRPQGPAIGVVKGRLLDAVNGQPVEYGTIALISIRDSVIAGGTISDPKGNFKVEQLQPGKYFARIQFMGYETKLIQNITIKPTEPEVALGMIQIRPTSANLSAVEVVAEREMMVNNLDKRIINVDKSVAAIGGSAVDVMQNIPSVTVDADGNVSLRGNSNITILVDGKPTGLAEISSSDLLEQIPATSIEAIEVITNPSVRYDAEGTSGIINIVLKKRSLQGLNGLISATAGTGDRYNSSINLNYRKNWFNVFAGYDNRFGKFNSTGSSVREAFNEGFSSSLIQDQAMRNKREMHNFNTGIDFLLNDHNTISFNYQFRKMSFGNTGDNTSVNLNQSGDTTRWFNRFTDGARNVKSNNYTLSYKRTFATRGKELTADFILTDNAMHGSQDITQQDYTFGYDPEKPLLQYSISNNSNRMYVAQANFSTPFSNGGRIETGFKSTIKDLAMRNIMSDSYYKTDELSGIGFQENNFDYLEQIHAVYGIYSASYNKFKYQAGLRAEQLISESYIIAADDKFNLSYLSLFPSVHTVYEISPLQQVSVSYSRRIRRPHNFQLNPYVDYSDSLNIRYGNPKLNPEFINSFEVGMANYWGKTSLNSTLFYRYTTGVIDRVMYLLEGGVTASTFENLANSQSFGLELIGNREFTEKLKANANVSLFRSVFDGTKITGGEIVKGNMWTAKLNITYVPIKNTSIMLAGNYRSAGVRAQTRNKAVFFTDIALKYDFMKNKASLNLRVSDLFDSRRFDGETWGEGFVINSKRKMESRVFYIGFSYRLNNYKNGNRDRNRDNQSGEVEVEEF